MVTLSLSSQVAGPRASLPSDPLLLTRGWFLAPETLDSRVSNARVLVLPPPEWTCHRRGEGEQSRPSPHWGLPVPLAPQQGNSVSTGGKWMLQKKFALKC